MDQGYLKEYRDYAWNYFSVHAAQRISVFQFFITLATAIIGGAVLIAGSAEDRKWAALLFLALPFLSFIFWQLDLRTSSLVKNAEDALKHLDKNVASRLEQGLADELDLFNRDDKSTGAQDKQWPFLGHFSYSRSFRYVFVAVALLGVIGSVIVLVFPAKKQERELSESITVIVTGERPAARTESTGTARIDDRTRIEMGSDVPFTISANVPSADVGTTKGANRDDAN